MSIFEKERQLRIIQMKLNLKHYIKFIAACIIIDISSMNEKQLFDFQVLTPDRA